MTRRRAARSIASLNGTGKITHAHEFTASDDQAAMKVADGWREGRRIELWQRARIVRKWD